MTPIAILALVGSAHAFDAQTVDGWTNDGEEVQYLDEDYEGGFDFDKVVGGKQVSNNRWDATVGVVMQGYVGCTGTLIHPKVVVTAAHCVGGISHVLVDATDSYPLDQSKMVAVADEIIHPDYRNFGSDIAVLKLANKVKNVRPADVALECVVNKDLDDGASVEVVGFGVTRESGDGFNSKLNHGGTFVQTKDCSAQEVDGYWTGCDTSVPGSEIGAGGNGVDACFGDSGGPLYLKADSGDFLVGVTSRSYAGVPQNLPCAYGGIYTRPDYFVKWIEDETGIDLRYSYCNEAPNVDADPLIAKPGATGRTTVSVIDPDGDAALATFEIVQQPEHGTVVIEAGGVFAYTPTSDSYLGQDSFTVEITDSGNDSKKRTGEPISVDLDIPVTIDEALFDEVSGEGAGCGCSSTGTGAVGWMGLLGVAGLIRRRR